MMSRDAKELLGMGRGNPLSISAKHCLRLSLSDTVCYSHSCAELGLKYVRTNVLTECSMLANKQSTTTILTISCAAAHKSPGFEYIAVLGHRVESFADKLK